MNKLRILKNPALVNVLFVVVFLNIWDFVVNRGFFNGMVFGLILFLPLIILWFIKSFKAVVLLTLISIFEFTVMFIFLLEGLELSGLALTSKTIFWSPYLVISGFNAFCGLGRYADYKKKNKLQIV